jgi:release factor glutamine methyltransferase
MMTVSQALAEATAALSAAGISSPAFDAKALLAEVMSGGDIGRLATTMRESVPSGAMAAFRGTVERRARREPLQYILGYTEFHGLRLRCDPRALIPRPDTETLVDVVLEALQRADERRQPMRCLCDIGAGTGAIAIALAVRHPGVTVWATDVSAEALALAAENVALHGLAGRVKLLQGDGLAAVLLTGIAEEIEAVISNPPYVAEAEYAGLEPEVVQHEPMGALVGTDADGLGFYRALCEGLPRIPRLRLVAFEVGHTQAAAVAGMLGQALAGFAVTVHRDLGGIERVVMAETTDD